MAGMRHLDEEQLVWFHYGDAEDAAGIELHLALCAKGRAEFESLQAAMAAVDKWPAPDRGPEYGNDVWRALLRRDASIGQRKIPWWERFGTPRRWVLAGALAALIIAAFLAGRVTGRLEEREIATAPAVV